MAKKRKNDIDSPAASKKRKAEKQAGYSWVKEFRYGRSISVEFFRQNVWLMLVILVSVIALIGLRYKTKTRMAEIRKLNTELERAESNKLQDITAEDTLVHRDKDLSALPQELLLEGEEEDIEFIDMDDVEIEEFEDFEEEE